MSGCSFSRQAVLLCVVIATQFFANDANDVESFLEYHFHTYFNEHDPVHVAQAIELRNEIIANCVAKKIIGVPLHYHYDPDNPVLERMLSAPIRFSENHLSSRNLN